MEETDIDRVKMLLGLSGVEVSRQRMESLAKTYMEYRLRLESLYSRDVGEEEIAGIFRPLEYLYESDISKKARLNVES